ncbi:uncharacterized protein TNCV_1725681 [Trichonephila clavipes]|nr:uncharacterized protein TNCV_1725681 [Trichonephila clavipes]
MVVLMETWRKISDIAKKALFLATKFGDLLTIWMFPEIAGEFHNIMIYDSRLYTYAQLLVEVLSPDKLLNVITFQSFEKKGFHQDFIVTGVYRTPHASDRGLKLKKKALDRWITTNVVCLAKTATAGSDVVQSGRPIFDDLFQHLCPYISNNTANVVTNGQAFVAYPHRPMTLHNPTKNSLAVLYYKILESYSQVQNVKLGGHQTCLSINRLWHELCDMLRRLVGTTAPGHHDCSIQE